MFSPAIQRGFNHAPHWGGQRIEDQQVPFLSTGGGQRFYHQIPQAVTQLLGLFQPMQNVAIGRIAITAADRVVGVASQKRLPEGIDHREIDR